MTTVLLSTLLIAQLQAWAAPAASPREELKKLTAQLQTSPSDQTLREKIIALALKLKPAPAVPEEAKRRMARGEAAFESAQTAEEVAAAVSEFQAAANAAPWLASAYYNLGLAQEKAGRPAESMGSLKLYLLAAPGAKDAAEVEKRIYKLEFIEEKKKNKATELAGKWGDKEELGKGEYTVEIFKDASGGYAGRPDRESFTKPAPDGRTTNAVTKYIEGFQANGGNISFVYRSLTVNSGSASPVTIVRNYDLSLGVDGKTLSGRMKWTWLGTQHGGESETILYRAQ